MHFCQLHTKCKLTLTDGYVLNCKDITSEIQNNCLILKEHNGVFIGLYPLQRVYSLQDVDDATDES